jgi:ribosomal protein L37AE/L43A
VRQGEQVLICPDCQRGDWTAPLDHCPACGSAALSRSLGETRCKSCGQVVEVAGSSPSSTGGAAPAGSVLSDEVAAAVERLLRGRPD